MMPPLWIIVAVLAAPSAVLTIAIELCGWIYGRNHGK